jgi:hypothetical protein
MHSRIVSLVFAVLLTINSASAAPANLDRFGEKATGGMTLSVTAGLEYGKDQEIFDFIDMVAEAFKLSDEEPGEPPPPGQNPGDNSV